MVKFTPTPAFKAGVKRLSKRYPSFRDDLNNLIKSLEKNPEQGVTLAGGFRKIRMAISSKGKGKSGGARVITLNIFVTDNDEEVILVSVYDKSEKDSITDREIKNALESLKK